jgi:phage I-like protein
MSATSSALGFAALSRQLNSDTQTSFVLGEDGYIQALPDGAFAAVDGRPLDVKGGKWLMVNGQGSVRGPASKYRDLKATLQI